MFLRRVGYAIRRGLVPDAAALVAVEAKNWGPGATQMRTPRATIEDGCIVQGCVVGPRAVVGAGTTLRECVVRAEAEVEEGEDLRAETLK